MLPSFFRSFQPSSLPSSPFRSCCGCRGASPVGTTGIRAFPTAERTLILAEGGQPPRSLFRDPSTSVLNTASIFGEACFCLVQPTGSLVLRLPSPLRGAVGRKGPGRENTWDQASGTLILEEAGGAIRGTAWPLNPPPPPHRCRPRRCQLHRHRPPFLDGPTADSGFPGPPECLCIGRTPPSTPPPSAGPTLSHAAPRARVRPVRTPPGLHDRREARRSEAGACLILGCLGTGAGVRGIRPTVLAGRSCPVTLFDQSCQVNS